MGMTEREYWLRTLRRIADPVLEAASRQRLVAEMPVESRGTGRERYTYLEAVGRLIAGLAPWLAVEGVDPSEAAELDRYRHLARAAVASIVDPASPDHCNFSDGDQPVVDAAFLALGLLRAPSVLLDGLDAASESHLASALESTRGIAPHYNNWLLFSAIVESALHSLGRRFDPMRLDYALRSHMEWYVGDGHYGDGPQFHWDYYNSYVIHPMLLAILDEVGDEKTSWQGYADIVRSRARRYAAVQERLIAADGSFPPIGRSIAYRAGAFHLLADAGLRGLLPKEVTPAGARCALGAVIRRTLSAPGTFDANGWLKIGLSAAQPSLGEPYISTGSLYLTANVFLPLGLPPTDPFWSDADTEWSAPAIWGGRDFPPDHAL